MGLAKPALRFLAREHRRKPFTGPVLGLGRPGVFATLEEARAIISSEGVAPAPLPAGLGPGTNIPRWKGTWNERFTSDVAFFSLLGLGEVRALDYSPYEEPDWVVDLNKPVPSELHGRFGLIIDPGTTEHVFDVRQCLMNIGLMLRPGGRVVSMVPANNYVNHGFYQFGPTLYMDYFGANGFADRRCFLVDEGRFGIEGWELYEWRGTEGQGNYMSRNRLSVLFTAEKTAESTVDRVPSQGMYAEIYSSGGDTTSFQHRPRSPGARARALLPVALEAFIRRYVLAYDPDNRLPRILRLMMVRLIPGFDKSRQAWRRAQKPWGLKLHARLD